MTKQWSSKLTADADFKQSSLLVDFWFFCVVIVFGSALLFNDLQNPKTHNKIRMHEWKYRAISKTKGTACAFHKHELLRKQQRITNILKNEFNNFECVRSVQTLGKQKSQTHIDWKLHERGLIWEKIEIEAQNSRKRIKIRKWQIEVAKR